MKKVLPFVLIIAGIASAAFGCFYLMTGEPLEAYMPFFILAILFGVPGVLVLAKRLKKERLIRGETKKSSHWVKYTILSATAFALLVGGFLGLDWWTRMDYAYKRDIQGMMTGDEYARVRAESLNGFRDSEQYIALYDCLHDLDVGALDRLLAWNGFPYHDVPEAIFSFYKTENAIDRYFALANFIYEYNQKVANADKITGDEQNLRVSADSMEELFSLFGAKESGKIVMLESSDFGGVAYTFDIAGMLTLPETQFPQSANSVSYALLTEYKKDRVGWYEGYDGFGGGAYQYIAHSLVYDIAAGDMIWSGNDIPGSEPPNAIPQGQSSATGEKPDMTGQHELALEFINSYVAGK